MENSVFGGVTYAFIPDDRLRRVIIESTVRKEISGISRRRRPFWNFLPRAYRARKLASHVCSEITPNYTEAVMFSKLPKQEQLKYLKIFAVLLLVGRKTDIWTFIAKKVSDEDLPLVRCGKSLARRSQSNAALPCFKHWSQNDIDNFQKIQWRVLVPIFGGPVGSDTPHHELERERILPFVEWSLSSAGQYARVYRARIHSDHHRFTDFDVS